MRTDRKLYLEKVSRSSISVALVPIALGGFSGILSRKEATRNENLKSRKDRIECMHVYCWNRPNRNALIPIALHFRDEILTLVNVLRANRLYAK